MADTPSIKGTGYHQKDHKEEPTSLLTRVALGLTYFFLIIFPFAALFILKFVIVAEYERIAIYRMGKLKGGDVSGPGFYILINFVDTHFLVDLRTVSFDVPAQEVLTRDSVTVRVDAVVYYRVFDPVKSVSNVKNVNQATRLLAQTTLRNILGTKTMAEILSDRANISATVQEELETATDPWGINVERVEVKDVQLPQQLQRAMAAEAEATRDARAKVISAEGEAKASQTLKEAADVIGQSPAALQLRYLQTLQSISTENNSTIVFPFPVEMLLALKGKSTTV